RDSEWCRYVPPSQKHEATKSHSTLSQPLIMAGNKCEQTSIAAETDIRLVPLECRAQEGLFHLSFFLLKHGKLQGS
ncbi:hypothetical protein DKP78_19950, partial [Enterococcus faecium]